MMQPLLITAIIVSVVITIALWLRKRGPSVAMMGRIDKALRTVQKQAAANILPASDEGEALSLDVKTMQKQTITVANTIRFIYTVEEHPEGLLHMVSSQLIKSRSKKYQVECMVFVTIVLRQFQFEEAGIKQDDVKLNIFETEMGTQYVSMLLTSDQHNKLMSINKEGISVSSKREATAQQTDKVDTITTQTPRHDRSHMIPEKVKTVDRELPPEKAAEHDLYFNEGMRLIEGQLILEESGDLSRPPGLFKRRKLNKAIQCFKQALSINQEGWSSMFFLGKIYQRLQEHSLAFQWFSRAFKINPQQVDIAREAGITATTLGRAGDAVYFCKAAVAIDPNDPGLLSNLALAYLISKDISRANDHARQAVEKSPQDEISKYVLQVIREVADGIRPQPKRTADIC
ncbi:MAG: tetratricopeptide repeat protein [Candidatus Hodarchaeales archaeon]|jgi:tetratricopeptide (TPR) repeat protein